MLVAVVAAAVAAVNTEHPHAHTGALFLAAHARTPDVITRLAQGLDDLFVCLKSHSIIGHVFVECSFDPVYSHFLILLTHCLSHATDGNQIKPVLLRSVVDRLADPIPNTGYEPKFCINVGSEHTPINLPSRNMSFPQEYDATITASEDLF